MENNNLVVHCLTKNEYIQIVDLIGWDSGGIEDNYDRWGIYKDKFAIRIMNNVIVSYGDIEYFRAKNSGGFENYTFLTAKNYLKNNLIKKTIMENIVEFAKNLKLSREEKLLRKYGLKDSNGNFTNDAINIVNAKIMAENEEYLITIAKEKDKVAKQTSSND